MTNTNNHSQGVKAKQFVIEFIYICRRQRTTPRAKRW